MSKESIVYIVNGVLLLTLVLCTAFKLFTLKEALEMGAMLAVPSAAPLVVGRLFEAYKRARDTTPPPPASGVLAIVLGLSFAGGTAATSSGCALFEKAAKAPAKTQACADKKLSVEECAAIYQAELVACTAAKSTLEDAVDCQNEVRSRYGRPLRAVPRKAYAADAGAELPPLEPDADEQHPAPRSPTFFPPALVTQTRGAS